METSMSDIEQSLLEEIRILAAENNTLQNELEEASKNVSRKEILKQTLFDECQVLEDEIISRKDENIALIKKNESKQLENLNYEKEIITSEIELLQEKNKSIALKIENDNKALNDEPVKSDDSDFQELYAIQEDYLNLKNILEDLQEDYNENLDSLKESKIFELRSLQESHQDLVSSYNIVKENLRNVKGILEEAQEHNAILSTELATLKAGENKQESASLFSEVEDKRQIILKKVKTLVTECEKLKKLINIENNAINKIKRDNTMLEMLFEDYNKFKEFKKEVQLAAEQRISDLESFISSLKKRPETQEIIAVTVNNVNLEWMHTLIKKFQLEVINLDKRYDQRFQQLMEYQFKLSKAQLLLRETTEVNSNQIKQIDEIKIKLASAPVQPTCIKPKTITFAEGTKE